MRCLLGCLLFSLGLTVPSAGLVAQAPDALGREALLASNAARFTAMVRADFRGLDTLLAPELIYVHSDGVVESKAEYLARLRTGRLRYQAIEPDDLEARVYGGAGLVTGRSRMQVKAGPKLLRFSIRFTSVYRRGRGGWVLVAWQATRLPDR